MFRIDRGFGVYVIFFAIGVLCLNPMLQAQPESENTGVSQTPPTTPPAPRQREDGPVRLAIATVAVHTPVFVQAYDRFLTQHGADKLQLELIVEQEWAENPSPLDFQSFDCVLALRCSIPGLEAALAKAAEQGTWVVSDSSIRHADYAAVIDTLPALAPYYRQRGVSNVVGLFEQICQLYDVPDVSPRPAEELPTQGLYHPAAGKVFSTGEDYWNWYQTTDNYKPDAPRVGVLVYNTLYLNEETDYFAELIQGIEKAGANPILGFWFVSVGRGEEKSSPMLEYFDQVDVLLSSSFRLMMEKSAHYEAMQQLNVPILNSIILNETTAEWRASRQGIAPSYMLPGIVTPELAGLIEPTVIAARQPVKNPATGQEYFRTVVIPENFDWQVRRALAWARLQKTKPDQKRVAVLYYNHGTGKQNIGASYLNVTSSLENILASFHERGYDVDNNPLSREKILASMQTLGRNIGNWAPDEIDELVEQGAVLWPLEEYLAYYDRLPAEIRQQITRQWGQPPGEVMTVTRDGQKYFVLPAFQSGNVVLAPQPSRAASDQHHALYHDPSTWPTHQYLAFYFWLRHEWDAHAVVHLGRHGTVEFLPGKSNGLSAADPPAIVIGDLPNIYPYIVDGIGEAVAAKRRGQAVLLTHATPPLTRTKLYEDLSKLQDLINRYAHSRDQKQSGLQVEYFKSIVESAEELGFSVSKSGESTKIDSDGMNQQVQRIEHWLAQVEAQVAPRGLHTFGKPYAADAVREMLPRMFKDEFARLEEANLDSDSREAWLSSISQAEGEAYASRNDDPDQKRIGRTAWMMRHNEELDYLARALNGEFIEVGPPGDPLSNPNIFPTGRNQYQYNPDKLPTKESWKVGKRMAEQTIELHRQRHGEFPRKLSVTLWANTMIRTDGVLESEVLHLLGVEPIWNSRGDLEDIQIVSPLGRPRVDVVMTVTGMYRDSFPEKILLLDRAIQLANDAPVEDSQPNYVRLNTEALTRKLVGEGASKEDSRKLALLRIFGAPMGQYGTGVHHFVNASQQWSEPSQVADQYLSRMANSFSQTGWAQPGQKIFKQQLSGVQAVIHGRSSNLYGIMDITENFEYQGALALSVEQLDGKQPDLYINDLVGTNEVLDGREAIVLELLSRYHNPDFIASMKQEGFDGAKYFSRIADNQFGWDVVTDLITAEDWQDFTEIYLEDRYELGLKEFFEQHNPHALQNIASRILEIDRKGLQELSEQTLVAAANAYVESVAKHGPACNSHMCSNPELARFAESLAAASGQIAQADLDQFRNELRSTGNEQMAKELTPAGGSTEVATAPQPVVGQVITAASIPGQQKPAEKTEESSTSPREQNSDEKRSASAQDAADHPGGRAPLSPYSIVFLGALLFVGGFAWRMLASRG